MVPTRRIELRAEHYHCSVLPLYYVGIKFIIRGIDEISKSILSYYLEKEIAFIK